MFSDLPNEDVVKEDNDHLAQFMEFLYTERYMTFNLSTNMGLCGSAGDRGQGRCARAAGALCT